MCIFLGYCYGRRTELVHKELGLEPFSPSLESITNWNQMGFQEQAQ